MKTILFALCMCMGLMASAQFKDLNSLNTYAAFPNGVGIEVGKQGESLLKPLGYYFGTTFEFGDRTSHDFDFTVYAKGELRFLTEYTSITALIGWRDFSRMDYGFGIRGIIPTKFAGIIIEPQWRNDGHSTLNAGFKFDL